MLKNFFDFRIIIDREKILGNFSESNVEYGFNFCKEQIARKYILEMPGEGLKFLDVGARDGKLDYLLGIKENLVFDQEEYNKNYSIFRKKYIYYGLDIELTDDKAIINGDICSVDFVNNHSDTFNYFDVIYSNNVFEHLKRPWVACKNLLEMLKIGGICITIAPFSLRYHESPVDYFRYTHTGIVALFEEYGKIRTLVSGYDLKGRRNNWQGGGFHKDICPVDHFGAWRENWFVITIIQKVE